MTFSMTLVIKRLLATLSITTLCHYDVCRVLFIVMLNVVMPNVIMLSVMAPEKAYCGKKSG
jgi:hypothetical protein